jgi:hypothetical protein
MKLYRVLCTGRNCLPNVAHNRQQKVRRRRSGAFCCPTAEYIVDIILQDLTPLLLEDGRLCYRGVKFVVKLGPLRLSVPEWLVLGHTTITEEAVDETHFAMDFRLTHPLLGQVFRYSGEFEAMPG